MYTCSPNFRQAQADIFHPPPCQSAPKIYTYNIDVIYKKAKKI